MAHNKKLIFVHNANSGYISAMVDGLHKSLKPSTYPCDLCALTYGAVRMKKDWKDFITNLPMEVEVTYRDKFSKDYPNAKPNLPSVYISDNGKLSEVIDADKFASLDSLEELIEAVKKVV